MRDLISEVWEAMVPYEYYTPRDLANVLGVSVEQVWRVMDLLLRYRFLELVIPKGALVKKVVGVPSPQMAALLLGKLADPQIGRQSP
jgi:hypothetical protein